MNENEKSRSGLQTAVDFAHAARAAKRIMQAAAASGVHGAAAATAREAFPLLLKVLIAVLVIFIAVPMVIFTALPNIFFGYNSSGTDTVIQMTQQAMTLGGVYMTLGNFEGAQIDSVVTGIAAEYEKNGTTIDHNDRQNIISSFAAYLKIAPNDLQMVARTLPADTQAYVEQMQRYAEKEDNEACREMIEDNIQEIGNGIASDAMRHRFFLVFQYEASMRAKRNTVDSIIQRLNEEADTARRYLDVCELEVLEPRYSDNFVLKLLYEILSKKTSQRVRLPDGVFDMTTAVHGIYEE